MQWVPGPPAPLCNWRSPTPQCTPFVCANMLRAFFNGPKNAPTKMHPGAPATTYATYAVRGWGASALIVVAPKRHAFLAFFCAFLGLCFFVVFGFFKPSFLGVLARNARLWLLCSNYAAAHCH